MAPKSKEEKIQIMKKNFQKLDNDGDGTLDFDELKVMLIKGNPTFTEDECRKLYNVCDSNGDGRVDFDEFLRYVYKADKSDAGRHARLAAASGPQVDDDELDWGDCQRTFEAFAGKDMDGREFAKFCVDCKFLNAKFKKVDIDIIFSKVVPKGQRRMDFNMFKNACRLVAAKRQCKNREIQQSVADSGGPNLVGTKAEYSKFHDDKSTYTGAHTLNEKHTGVDASAKFGRHDRIAAEHDNSNDTGNEALWSECERVFNAFAGASLDLDGKEFFKMCLEIDGLVHGKFKREDIDVIFSGVAKGQRRIGFQEFKKCVRDIARKKNIGVESVQECIVRSKGPNIEGTKAEYNRFHDDKSSYTGTHTHNEKHQGADPNAALGRHEKLSQQREEQLAAQEAEEDPWDECERVFSLYAGTSHDLDGREFYKMCLEVSNLVRGSFKREDIDTVFATAARGEKKIGFDQFKICVREIARKKGEGVYATQACIARNKGPENSGTKAEYNKFYDDKTTWTGVAGKEQGF